MVPEVTSLPYSLELLESCPNCSSPGWAPWSVGRQSLPQWVQCRCRECSLIFTNPVLTQRDLERFYQTYYSAQHSESVRADQRAGQLRAAESLLDLLPTKLEPGALLEIGSGNGSLLALARDAGWNVFGVELSQEACRYAAEQWGLSRLVCGSLEATQFPDGAFDAIIAWHVLEHIRDLDGTIRELGRILRPGGLLVIGTENAGYPVYRWQHHIRRLSLRLPAPITSQEHTFVFSRQTLRDVLERRGLHVIRCHAYDEIALIDRIRLVRGRSLPRLLAVRALVAIAAVAASLNGQGPFLSTLAVRRGAPRPG